MALHIVGGDGRRPDDEGVEIVDPGKRSVRTDIVWMVHLKINSFLGQDFLVKPQAFCLIVLNYENPQDQTPSCAQFPARIITSVET